MTTASPSHLKELRSRERLLNLLLSKVLKRQLPPPVYQVIGDLRLGFIALRARESKTKRQQLIDLINRQEPEALSQIIRAFNLYFSLINIAEEAIALRERRRAVQQGAQMWPGSFHDTLHSLRDEGVDAAALKNLFGQLCYLPVITAHPSEAKRRTIKGALRNIFLSIEALDDPRVRGMYRDEAIQQLSNQIHILWNTDEVRASKLDVSDEIRTGLSYFPLSLFQAVTQVYRNFTRSLADVYGPQAPAEIGTPSFLRFGSWIGGDRDGHPLVTTQVTAQAWRMQAQTAYTEYLRRLERLSDQLSYSIRLCRPSDAFMADLDDDVVQAGAMLGANEKRYLQEPYRRKLELMWLRIRRNLDLSEASVDFVGEQPGYASDKAFLKDLHLIRDSLISHGDSEVANRELLDLIRLVETFGFHLLQLDVRQESGRHSQTVAEVLRAALDIDYLALDEGARLALLSDTIAHPNALQFDPADLSPSAQETLQLFHLIAHARRNLGAACFGKYVISMTHSASHVMEVMLLASQAGLAGQLAGNWYCHIGISPLFETIEDLHQVEAVLTQLYQLPVYRSLLDVEGNGQEVMLGYSDSCKDGGILASAWSLYDAQKRIVAVSQNEGIPCRLFHGRGGTLGRGGGPTYEAILAQPAGTVSGQLKLTEQGEVLFYKYNNMETAVYELTLGVSGLLRASSHLIGEVRPDRKDYLGIMDEIARAGEHHYRLLTEQTPGFLDYFYEATPVREIGLMNIGSRPSHRKSGDRSKNSVRAIGWVFAWGQSRHALPAWYGIGAALESWRGNDLARLAKLQHMYREWPFFRTLLANAQMALTKTDMNIAREYASLCPDAAVGKQVYDTIREEYARSIRQILNVADIQTLLEESPELAISLNQRNPYLDPLNHIQVVLLRKLRQDQAADSDWLEPLLRSINAIAAGMRNTG
ncbi:MAG: phosphoenolpyruvate carboxylase [Hydrogenophilales bacterium 28-61-23]|nr:MAG: phosphoenolpyruvate carboxylase [Hydrogenophilales bacterium 28-61-23]